MKKLLLALTAITASTSVLASTDYNYEMMGSGMMSAGWMFAWLIYFVLVAFIFSLIFWLTYKWVIRK